MAITLAPTPRENQEELENIDDDTIFIKNSVLNHFQNLKDTRIDRSKDHLLIDIIAISILAVISGADGWTAIETYGKAKEQFPMRLNFICLHLLAMLKFYLRVFVVIGGLKIPFIGVWM